MERNIGRLVAALALVAGALNVPAQTPAPSPAPAAGSGEKIQGAVWLSAEGGLYRDAVRLDPLLGAMARMPFGELIVQVVDDGRTYYNTPLLPRAIGLSASLDPLGQMLEKLRADDARPLRMIAWIEPLAMGNVNLPLPTELRPVEAEHPEWLSVDREGRRHDADGNQYLEPGLPEVRQWLAQLVGDLAKRYPVDGIYFDPVSDAGPEWGYHPTVVQEWRRRTGRQGIPEVNDAEWIALRGEMLTETLRAMSQAARRARPGIIVGVGVSAAGPAPESAAGFELTAPWRREHQPWPRWMELKLVDRVYLKNFRGEAEEGETFTAWTAFALDQEQRSGVPAYIGVAGYLNESIPALRQLQRGAQMGARGLALATWQQPTRDPATRDLFLSAVAETALSAQYVARQAMPRPSTETRSAAAATTGTTGAAVKPATETTGAQAAAPAQPAIAAAAPAAEADAGPLSALDVALSMMQTAVTTGTLDTTATGIIAELPPPPEIGVEEGMGRMLPAGERRTTSRGGPGTGIPTDEELEALKRLAGIEETSGTMPAAQTAAPGQSGQTRRDQLLELMRDPRYRDAREMEYLKPTQQAEEYLRVRFENIFE